MADLVELDAVEILVIIDNELDPISPCPNADVQQSGGMKDIAVRGPTLETGERGDASRVMRMNDICCSAHGLSLMITGVKGEERHTVLFDTGPEEQAWERNATRLRADIGKIELIHLSHWHRDHSGGMLKALDMIATAKAASQSSMASNTIDVDLHPDRPAYRGMRPPDWQPISWEADPSFAEIEQHGGTVRKNDQPHTVAKDFFLISGEIPKVSAYEKGLKYSVRFDEQSGKWLNDEAMADERFLMCKVKGKGILMFTGCSHTGVVNASRNAIELGNGTSLYGVMGGFHLADAEPALIRETVSDLKALGTKLMFSGHCTGWRAKFEIERQVPGCLVPSFVGTQYRVEGIS